MKKKILGSAVAIAIASMSSFARAEDAPPPPADTPPALHHAPKLTAHVGDDLVVSASVDRPDRVKRAMLVYRSGPSVGEVDFQRSSDDKLPYVAVIPASAIHGDEVYYDIELETTQGEHMPVFATRDDPHRVTVLQTPEDAREASLFSRLGGRRSVVQASSEFVSFGSVDGDIQTPTGTQHVSTKDQYYRVEGSYTYRLMGTIAEFGLRAGVVRGRSLVPGEADTTKYDVGLNYGAPRVRLRATDWLHFEGELLTSVTEVGFSVGGGGAVLIGDAYGSKIVFGGEGIQVFGGRGYTRLDVVANKRLMLSPTIEVTNMPHADRAGVRLLGDAGIDVGNGIRLDLRGGYQARSFERGGPTIGGGLAYIF
ncbi:MAG TPA: hypothetical protein VIF62_25645 [Labilithrix sp.]